MRKSHFIVNSISNITTELSNSSVRFVGILIWIFTNFYTLYYLATKDLNINFLILLKGFSDRRILCTWLAVRRSLKVSPYLVRIIQSTLVISKSKGLSEILRDIRTSTYQICRIEEKRIRTTTFNKYICNLTLEVRDILKILCKRGEIAP